MTLTEQEAPAAAPRRSTPDPSQAGSPAGVVQLLVAAWR